MKVAGVHRGLFDSTIDSSVTQPNIPETGFRGGSLFPSTPTHPLGSEIVLWESVSRQLLGVLGKFGIGLEVTAYRCNARRPAIRTRTV
jgi:hypothetical protein